VIITLLMIAGRSPGYSAFWATISCVVISWFKKETRMGIREIWDAIQTGARNTLIIGATVGVIGIIVGTISLSGMGLKFSDLIIHLAGGRLFLALILIGLASLVLGMGVPVTAAYLIVAVLAVPPLGELGVAAISAHMIVYWFSQDSNITPPVCVAAYAGAAIAGADPWRTGWTAFKFAKLLYVMPILFAYTPAILFDGTNLEIFMSFLSAFLGTLAFSSLTMMYMIRRTTLVEWLIFAVATILLYWPTLVTDIVGLMLVGVVYMMQRAKNKREFGVAHT
jgi:TRAP transporter 4TM/12TM fusion protein